MQKQQQRQQETSTLRQKFLYGIKSKETQKLYQTTIGYFEEWHQNKIEDLLKLDAKAIDEILTELYHTYAA